MAERLLGVHGLQCHTGGDGSFAYDLDVQRGIVSGRVALLLRSAEIKPLLSGLYLIDTYALASESEGVQKSQPPRRGLPRSGGDDYSTPRPLAEEWLSGTNSNFKRTTTVRRFVCHGRSCRVQKIVGGRRRRRLTRVVGGGKPRPRGAKLAPKPGSEMED